MPGATRLCRAGHVSRAVKRVTRNHFCSNTDRGGREETVAARVLQKHPLRKCSRCIIVPDSKREVVLVTEPSIWRAFSGPGSTEAVGGYRSRLSCQNA